VDGREILLYLIMYRKYVRKWRLLKRNRIICPEVAVNEQFLPGKSNGFLNCLRKSKFFKTLVKLPEKIEISLKCARKIEIFLTRIHDPPDFKPDCRRCMHSYSETAMVDAVWSSVGEGGMGKRINQDRIC